MQNIGIEQKTVIQEVSVLKGKGCRNLFIAVRICFGTERQKKFGQI